MERIIGIDLGTTNSEVAVIQAGRPIIIPVDGDKILPSVVGRDPASGRLLVGQAARNQYILHPRHTVRSIKRRMGKPEKVMLGEELYSPEEISAMILKRLKAAAEEYLEAPVQKAVITVPAYFNDVQRRATKTAGEIAGLEVVRILNEPTAAALAHGLLRQEDQICLVYDLGGGTFDVSVVERSGGVLEVLASHGNTALGGDDFDGIVRSRLIEEFQDGHGIDLSKDLHALARMTQAAEKIKIALSDAPYYEVQEEFIAAKQGAPLNLIREVSRQELEAWIGPLIKSTRESIKRALADAKIPREKVQKILLVGGSTRIPLVWRIIEESLGQLPHAEVDPALAVALGAAIQGGILAGEEIDMILVDVAAHSLGIEVLETHHGLWIPHVFSRIIPRNSAVPVRRSEVYSTIQDNQDAVRIKIYQGEREIATENTLLGEFLIEDLRPAPAGEPEIVVSFDYDTNGMLRVTAQERGSNNVRELTVKVFGPGMNEEELKRAAVRVETASGVSSKEAAQGSGEAVADEIRASHGSPILARARQVMARCRGEDRKRLGEAIVRYEQALASRAAGAAELEERLVELLYKLES